MSDKYLRAIKDFSTDEYYAKYAYEELCDKQGYFAQLDILYTKRRESMDAVRCIKNLDYDELSKIVLPDRHVEYLVCNYARKFKDMKVAKTELVYELADLTNAIYSNQRFNPVVLQALYLVYADKVFRNHSYRQRTCIQQLEDVAKLIVDTKVAIFENVLNNISSMCNISCAELFKICCTNGFYNSLPQLSDSDYQILLNTFIVEHNLPSEDVSYFMSQFNGHKEKYKDAYAAVPLYFTGERCN